MKEHLATEPPGTAPVAIAEAPEWAPAVDARLTRVGVWMLLIADLFFFVAFLLAFFWLRSMNNNHSWLPPGTTHPTRAIGALIVGLMIVTAGAYMGALRNVNMTRALLWLAFAAGVLAIGVQLYEFRHLGFDPQQGGGFPSVFVGLKGVLMVQFAAALLWLLTHIAQARPAGDLFARLETAATFTTVLFFLAGISLIAYLVMYFV
jgi:heme/copper-type cytochrome/quinol oxidase subunit 3